MSFHVFLETFYGGRIKRARRTVPSLTHFPGDRTIAVASKLWRNLTIPSQGESEPIFVLSSSDLKSHIMK